MGMNKESTRKPSSSRSRRSNSGFDHFSDSSPDRRLSSRSLRRRERNSGERVVTEEEIKDYMAKKAQKKAMSVAKKLKTQTVSGYSNESNPFGDSSLNEKFVWRNKIERDVSLGVALDEYSMKSEKKKQKDRMAEIEKVKKRRVERAREKAQREDEMMVLQRERSRAKADDFEKEEEELHFDHSEVRSVLSKYLDDESDEFDVEFDDPYVVLKEKKRLALKEQLELRAKKIMGSLEEYDAVFGSAAEINLDSQVYWWHDKFRPRKPKYFNHVHTCYEWNKYNQTHCDHDNPPPKIVRGYKFNIFYPDLVDKIKAPTYLIEKDGDRAETCVIRFHAGPPYEDIAFRIVNKEWEYSHKKGYKCTFESGILHVYFNFNRHRYRR